MAFLTGKEVQLLSSESGRLSSLKDPEVRQAYGKNLKSLEGKHLQAIFKTRPASIPPITKNDLIVRPFLTNSMKDVLLGNTDVNTALRTAEEEANKAIDAANK
jgi:multiple sugar transport system substrate-binding protein